MQIVYIYFLIVCTLVRTGLSLFSVLGVWDPPLEKVQSAKW